MLVTIDKRGSIGLPAELRRELGFGPGTCLDLSVQEGGTLILNAVAVYPTLHLAEGGLQKLEEARQSGVASLPDWLREDMTHAPTDSQP